MKKLDEGLVKRLKEHFSEGDRVTVPLLCRAWRVNYNQAFRYMNELEILGAIESDGKFKRATFA